MVEECKHLNGQLHSMLTIRVRIDFYFASQCLTIAHLLQVQQHELQNKLQLYYY